MFGLPAVLSFEDSGYPMCYVSKLEGQWFLNYVVGDPILNNSLSVQVFVSLFKVYRYNQN